MKIGLIVATLNELESLLANLKVDLIKIKNDPFELYEFTLKGKKIYVAKSGIGEIASASLTQYLICNFGIDLIINAGVVGTLKSDIKLGHVCIVKDVVHYDFDLSKIDNVKVGEYEGIGVHIPLNQKYINLLKEKFPSLKVVSCASGDKFVDDQKFIDYLIKTFNCDICDMELAGITLTAIRNNVDVISIKSISDAGNSDDYNNNVNSSCEVLYLFLNDIIDQF